MRRLPLFVLVAILGGCGFASIPERHIQADEDFVESIESEYFEMLAAVPSLNGATVTAHTVDLRRAEFHAFRLELQRIRALRAQEGAK